MAEQNAVITTSTNYDHIMPSYTLGDKNIQQHHMQQLQQQKQQSQQIPAAPTPHHSQYVQYNTLIPVSKMSAFKTEQHPQQHSSKVSQLQCLKLLLHNKSCCL